MNVGDVPNVIAACSTLHNICEIHGDSFDESWLEGVETTGDAAVQDVESSPVESVDIRQAFMSYFQ